jgi:hypothetical protein
MRLEKFFDLSVATVSPGEAPPSDAHLARIEEPAARDVERFVAQGWFYKPRCVTYVLERPASLESYIADAFRAGSRSGPRRLLREVPKRYRHEVGEAGRGAEAFLALYRRTIAARPLGLDRIAERETRFGPGWTGFYLFDGTALVAGLMVRALRDRLSAAYGAFDHAHRALDLEHFLIMQAIRRCIETRAPRLSLGRDTNLYGHHLPLGLAPYKLRLGFQPLAYERSGRELLKVQSFAPFRDGLFFYGYAGEDLEGNLFARGEPDSRPFTHRGAPPVRPRTVPPAV